MIQSGQEGTEEKSEVPKDTCPCEARLEAADQRRSVKSILKGGKKLPRNTFTRALHGESIFTAAKRTCTGLPFRLWSFFIDAFVIQHYRPEWGKYTEWDHNIPTNVDGTRKRRKSARRLSKLHQGSQLLKTLGGSGPLSVAHDHSECSIIRINVSGQIFEPQARTLNQFPSTLLGDPKRMVRYYDPERDEFFFDRHRSTFEAILYYYQSGGILRRPPAVHVETFIEEVKFFDLGQKLISTLEDNEGLGGEEERPLPKNLLKRKLWLLFEYPESSYQSRIMAYFSIIVICISVFDFCIDTVPIFHMVHDEKMEVQAGVDTIFDLRDPFFLLETMCIAFFVFEYTMRLLTCPQFFPFLKDLTNLIDLVAILPYFFNVLFNIPEPDNGGKPASKTASLTILRIIRLVRVFRIFKLSRHNRGLKILGKTLKASINELGLLVFFLCIGVIVFSSAMYFADHFVPGSAFNSIPEAFWFTVVTMTTLGYGDMVPTGHFGKIVGALCAIAGVLTISLPVPVIVSNFNLFYNRDAVNKTDNEGKPGNDHVEQCPFYPGWYTPDGQPLLDKHDIIRCEKGATSCRRWLFGDQSHAFDHSDSEFETIKFKDEYKPSIWSFFTKKHRSRHARSTKK